MTKAELPNLKKCPKCGADGKLKVTSGGFDYYYSIHCTKCDHNSRGAGNILPGLYNTDSPDTPQKTKEAAYLAWNNLTS